MKENEEKADVLFETKLHEQAEKQKFRTVTETEQREINKQTEHRTGIIIRAARIIRDNPDIIILIIIVLSFLIAGYWIAKIKLGLSNDQIKIQIWDFLEFVGIMIVGVTALIGKLFVAPGVIAQSLSKSAQKEADSSGRTLIK